MSGKYIIASGSLYADFATNAAAECRDCGNSEFGDRTVHTYMWLYRFEYESPSPSAPAHSVKSIYHAGEDRVCGDPARNADQ